MSGEGGEAFRPDQRKGLLDKIGNKFRTLLGKKTVVKEVPGLEDVRVIQTGEGPDIITSSKLSDAYKGIADMIKEKGLWDKLVNTPVKEDTTKTESSASSTFQNKPK